MLAHYQGESLCASLSKIIDTPVNGRPSLFGIHSVHQMETFLFHALLVLIDGRFSVVEILAYYAKVRGFDSRTVQTFVCMNMCVCIGSGCFYVYRFVGIN
jgi:hypothetical protein